MTEASVVARRTRRSRLRSGLAAILAASAISCLDADCGAKIVVVVRSASGAIAGAQVELDQHCCGSLYVDGRRRTSCKEVTDDSGRAQFVVGMPDACELTTSAPGFQAERTAVSVFDSDITCDDTVAVDVELQP